MKNKLSFQVAGGLALFLATVLALLFANASHGTWFQTLWTHAYKISWWGHSYSFSLRDVINEGGMTLFFLLVGLEIKHEFVEGELASFRKASMPVIAALGGMIVPACIYLIFCYRTPFLQGWAIPIATDIAFASGVLALFGKRIPSWAKVFLISLAVVDDIGSVIVIAIFYAHSLFFKAIALALLMVGLMGLLRFWGVRRAWVYLGLGVALWISLHYAGIHPTLAGVVVAGVLPSRTKRGSSEAEANHRPRVPVSYEKWLSWVVTFVILPLFALCNASIKLPDSLFQGAFHHPAAKGVFFGLIVGKPAGIVGLLWVAIRLKLVQLPHNASWGVIASVAFLAGIGFTISLFMAQLSFADSQLQELTKVGILLGSFLSAITGSLLLFISARARSNKDPS